MLIVDFRTFECVPVTVNAACNQPPVIWPLEHAFTYERMQHRWYQRSTAVAKPDEVPAIRRHIL